jgi:hypothetical protein
MQHTNTKCHFDLFHAKWSILMNCWWEHILEKWWNELLNAHASLILIGKCKQAVLFCMLVPVTVLSAFWFWVYSICQLKHMHNYGHIIMMLHLQYFTQGRFDPNVGMVHLRYTVSMWLWHSYKRCTVCRCSLSPSLSKTMLWIIHAYRVLLILLWCLYCRTTRVHFCVDCHK